MSNSNHSENQLNQETKKQNETESNEEPCSESGSAPSSLAYSGDNEEEYLRATFARLGVGHDGYLSLEELTKVCCAIGMDKVAAEVIDQLFSRLDVDGDGRISFEEFLHMFQNGGPDTMNSSALDDSLSQDSSLLSNPGCLLPITNPAMFVSEFGLFSTLDPEGTGYVSVSRVVEAWFSVGLSDGARLLRELGLPHRSGQRLRLRDLANALEDELRPPTESSQLARQAAILTLLHEIKGLRASFESARGERDKCRWDLGEANHRLALLAQELDDHNTTMENNSQRRLEDLERQYKDQIRKLQELLTRERENGRETALSDSKELLSINSHLQEEEARLKAQIATLKMELKKLESENVELSLKLTEIQGQAHLMEKQIQEFKQLKNKVAEYENSSPREEEFRKLAAKVDILQSENQALRDSNDELIAQVDAYSSRFVLSKQDDYSLDGSCIGDYLDTSSNEGTLGGLKRRGESSPLRKTSPEDGNSEDDDNSPRGSKIRKRNTPQINFQYLDVTSHDESFLDCTFPPVDERSIAPNESPLREFASPTATPKSSQPSSLPLFLLQSSPRPHSSRSKVEELEKDIKALKKEREDVSQEVLKTKLILKDEADSSLKSDPGARATENSVALSPIPKHSRFARKCQQCIELESRLNIALEELEMSLKRETVLSKSEDKDATPLVEAPTKMVLDLCQDLCAKLRREYPHSFGTSFELPQSKRPHDGGRDAITTIPEEDELEESSDEDSGGRNNETAKTRGLEGTLKKELENIEKVTSLILENLSRERERLEKDKALAEDRLSRVEQDLQVLRVEYEKSEDYWHLKFQEEQDYYDEERKLYDEKFSALESKIKEYEALAASGAPIEVSGPTAPGDALSDVSDDRLSTIDESAMWERQVTDLEEEVRCLQKKLLQLNEEKENLDISWREKLTAQQRNAQQECSQLKAELEQVRGTCRNLESQLKSVHEELSHFKRNFGHESELFSLLHQGNVNGYEPSFENQQQLCGSSPQGDDNNAASEQADSSYEVTAQENLRMQLLRSQKRIRHLEHSLKMRQKCSNEIINQAAERQKVEIQNLQSMRASTQQMLTTNLAKYKDQLTKVARGDMLVRDLYLENTQLMLALKVTEERQKAAEERVRKLQMSTMTQTAKN